MKILRWEFLGLILFVYLVMQPGFQEFAKSFQVQQTESSKTVDSITIYAQELGCVEKFLPERGMSGYLYGGEPTCSPSDHVCTASYYQTAYNLAPLVVARGADYDWVIVQVAGVTTVDQIQAKYPLRLKKRCGEGLLLFRSIK